MACHVIQQCIAAPLPTRAQAYNARRQDDLDALQAEADAVVQHLREQQQVLAARDRAMASLEKQLSAR